MTDNSNSLPEIIVLSICHDQQTENLYLEHDGLNDYEILGYLSRALRYHHETMDAEVDD